MQFLLIVFATKCIIQNYMQDVTHLTCFFFFFSRNKIKFEELLEELLSIIQNSFVLITPCTFILHSIKSASYNEGETMVHNSEKKSQKNFSRHSTTSNEFKFVSLLSWQLHDMTIVNTDVSQ